MTKKQKYILIITLIIVLLVILMVFLLTRKEEELIVKKEDPQIEKIVDLVDNQVKNDIKSDFNSIEFEKENEFSDEFVIKMVARNFIERYATWSIDNKMEGIEAIKNISTDTIFKAVYNERQAYQVNAESKFYGITSRVLDFKILDLEDAKVKVALSIQQEEKKIDNTKINYQDLELELVKNNDEWLVSSIFWK
ncbi:hypothetical protein K8R66_00195 [bacterium]|nr:hypothetical protein [bacterium]